MMMTVMRIVTMFMMNVNRRYLASTDRTPSDVITFCVGYNDVIVKCKL